MTPASRRHMPDDPPRAGSLEPDPASAELGVIVAKPSSSRAPLRATGMASNVWMFGLAGVIVVLLLLFLVLI